MFPDSFARKKLWNGLRCLRGPFFIRPPAAQPFAGHVVGKSLSLLISLCRTSFFFPARNSLLVSKNIAVIATTNNPSLVRLLIKYSSNILAAKSREIIIHADLMVFPPFFSFYDGREAKVATQLLSNWDPFPIGFDPCSWPTFIIVAKKEGGKLSVRNLILLLLSLRISL